MVDSKGSLFNFKRPPILLIGSGIVKRYVKDSCTWHELLGRIAERTGIDKERFKAYESLAMGDCDERVGHLPKLASNLSRYVNEELISGNLRISEILPQDFYELYMDSADPDPIKFLVAAELKKAEMTADPGLLEEIALMRKLPDVVPSVVTTNFDKFIEEKIFDGRFAVYSRVSDYYLSGSKGIGEIYKIHGTVDHPEDMVLNEEDYIRFLNRSKIVSAKILSILCDYPMIIMGYSMNDPSIINIMGDLIASLDEDKLAELNDNIVYVDRVEGKADFEWGDSQYGYDGKRVRIRTLKTDDFRTIFEELSTLKPSKSPSEIRRFRQLVKKVVASTNPNAEAFYYLGIDEISAENQDKLVIGIGEERSVRAYSDYIIFNLRSLLTDVLYDKREYEPQAALDGFTVSRARVNEFIPIFHYLRDLEMDVSEYPTSIINFIRRKKEQFAEKLKNPVVKGKLEKGEYTEDAIFDETVQHHTKPLLIM